jgi:hypothetical protein
VVRRHGRSGIPDVVSTGNGLRPGWAAGIALLALALMVAAHVPMQEQRMPAWVAAALVAGVALWITLTVRVPPPREKPQPLAPAGGGPRIGLLAASVVLSVLAWKHTSAGTYRLPGVATWLAATACWILAWRARGSSAEPVAVVTPPEVRHRWLPAAALLALLLIGAVFLFYRLAETPGNPYSDHAEKLLDILDLQNGQRPIFFVRNTGREPFQFYWTFALMEFFGLPLRYLTLKIGTAIIGLLALPALYLLGREMGGTRLGLAVAALAAWSKWPVSLARNGLRYTLGALPTVIVLWALLRYFRRGDRASILWAGLAIGLGLHGYSTFRVVPLLALLVFGFVLIDTRRRARRRGVLLDGVALAGTAFVVALPLIHYMLQHADQFWYRAATRVASVERAVGPDRIAIFGRNLWNMLLAFSWRGSSSWVLIREYEPFLDAVTASFLVAGVVLLILQMRRGGLRWAILPAAFLVLTLPSTLSLAFPIENPSINRAGTAIPVVFLIAGLPIIYLLSSQRRSVARVAAAGIATLLLFSIEENARQYFVGFDRQYAQRIDHSTQMSRVLDEYRRRGVPLGQMYLLYTDYWVDGRNIALELGQPSWAETHIVPTGKLPKGLRERPLVFLHTPGAPILEELQRTYPGTDRLVRQNFSDRDFSVYFAP